MRDTSKHIKNFPFQAVNASLSLSLKHDTVHVSKETIRHMRERHPKDFELCMGALESIITAPDYIGQEPHHPENFEMIKRVNNAMVLVAISTIADEYGDYPVQSSYVIPEDTLHRRLRKKHVKPHQ